MAIHCLLIKQLIAINSSLKLQTTFVNSEGKSILRTETKKAFLENISKKEPTTT